MAVPLFPEFKPVSIEDRPLLQDIFRQYNPETSELNFTNAFIWRRQYDFRWSLLHGHLLLGALAPSGSFFLPPVGPPPRHETMREMLLENPFGIETIQRADERTASEIGASGAFDVTETPEHFDYVYLTEDLARLPGNRYHAKRNQINGIARVYDYRFGEYEPGYAGQCLSLAESWCGIKHCRDDQGLANEYQAVREIIENFPALGIKGGVILIENRIRAFAFGENLNPETAVVHIEKADPEIRGMYALINQQFCERTWTRCRYINREQDLGDAGLEKAKKSYHPARLVKKFTIRAKIA